MSKVIGGEGTLQQVWVSYCSSRDHISKIYEAARCVVQTETHRVRDAMFLCDELQDFVQKQYPNDPNLKKVIEIMYKETALSAKQTSAIEEGFLSKFGSVNEELITTINSTFQSYTEKMEEFEQLKLKYDILRSSKKIDNRVPQLEEEIKSCESAAAALKTTFLTLTNRFDDEKPKILADSLVMLITEQQQCLMNESNLVKSARPYCLMLKSVKEESKVDRSALMLMSTQKPYISKRGYVQVQRKKGAQGWKKSWMTIDEGVCCFWASHRSTSPSKRMDLAICRAAPMMDFEADRSFCFKIQSPERIEVISSLDEQQRDEWLSSIQSNISYCLRCTSDGDKLKEKFDYLKTLQQRSRGELVCGDCGVAGPEWAITNLGMLVCHECAGVHRSFGVHISRVRSLTMDYCHPEIIESLLVVGRDGVGAVYLKNCPETTKKEIWKVPQIPRSLREKFLRQKYIEKEFVSANLQCSGRPTRGEVLENCSRNDYVGYISLLARGLNLPTIDANNWVAGQNTSFEGEGEEKGEEKMEKEKEGEEKEEGEGKGEEKEGEEKEGRPRKKSRAKTLQSRQKCSLSMMTERTPVLFDGSDDLSSSFSPPLSHISNPPVLSSSFSTCGSQIDIKIGKRLELGLGDEGDERKGSGIKEPQGGEVTEREGKGKRGKSARYSKAFTIDEESDTHVEEKERKKEKRKGEKKKKKREKKDREGEESDEEKGEEEKEKRKKAEQVFSAPHPSNKKVPIKNLSRRFLRSNFGTPLFLELIMMGEVNLVMLELLLQGGLPIDGTFQESSKRKSKKKEKEGKKEVEEEGDCEGWSALHFAASMNRLDYCSFLMARGVDPRLKASDGRTPIDLAHENGFVDCTDCLNGVKEKSGGKAEEETEGECLRAETGEALELLKARLVILRHKYLKTTDPQKREEILLCLEEVDKIISS